MWPITNKLVQISPDTWIRPRDVSGMYMENGYFVVRIGVGVIRVNPRELFMGTRDTMQYIAERGAKL